jgi:hypothetical protein
MAEYTYAFNGTVNATALGEALKTENAAVTGISTRPGEVVVYTSTALSAQEQADLGAIVAAHNPAALSTRQEGLAQLSAFLDSRVDDLKYGDYFYRLQKRLIDLWGTKPNLTDTTLEVVAALKANRDTDTNHLQMWNVYCWKVNIDFGIPITPANGTPYQELPVAPTAAQARQIVQCAYDFMNTGVQMLNMILLNQRG